MAIFITHAANPAEGKFVITPNLVGASKDRVVSIPDIVMYMETVDEGGVATRVAHLGNSSFLVTKNRVGLPFKILNPTMPDLYNEMWRMRAVREAALAAAIAPVAPVTALPTKTSKTPTAANAA